MVAKKRGFFAELHHQNQLAAKRREQAARAAHRAHAAAVRQAEQLQKDAERARASLARASAAEQKAAAAEAKRAHDEAMMAEAEMRNSALTEEYEQIDSLLSATLDVDDWVDVRSLLKVANHPPFPRNDLVAPLPPPPPIATPPEPQFVPPAAPGGLSGMLGRKKHADAVTQAQAAFAQHHEAWRHYVAQMSTLLAQQAQAYRDAERQRMAALDRARGAYASECQQREELVEKENGPVKRFIEALNAGDETAVQEYIGMVLGNSVYPDSFPVEHDFDFVSSLRELTLRVSVLPPSAVPAVKEYKYQRSKDEIVTTALPVKAQKDRYAGAVAQVASRTLHEVFEADRAGWIQTISLTVGTNTIDEATGLAKEVPLVAVASDRSFLQFDLSNVVPAATLHHLNAEVSRDPYGLVPIDVSDGVRGRR
jgi:restriction system protein